MIKEQLKQAIKLNNINNIIFFDCIYFKPTKRKHSSGYNILEIYGSLIDKNEKETFFSLSKISDVIDFEKIITDFNWFASIDVPEYNIFRIFTRNNRKFKIEFLNISSFKIEIV